MKSHLNWKAIVLGAAIDFGGSVFVGGIARGIWLSLHASGRDQTAALARTLTTDPTYLLFALGLGLPLSVLGGYVAARIARPYIYQNAAAVGVVEFIIGAMLGALSHYPAWFSFANVLLLFAALALGAALAGRHSPRQAQPPPLPPRFPASAGTGDPTKLSE